VPLTREQARHFLHPDPGQGRIILLSRAQGIGQQGAAAPPLLILAHISAETRHVEQTTTHGP